MRHPEPQVLIDWRAIVDNPPQVCHNCDHYLPYGLCEKFNSKPPIDFATTPGSCAAWVELIPF